MNLLNPHHIENWLQRKLRLEKGSRSPLDVYRRILRELEENGLRESEGRNYLWNRVRIKIMVRTPVEARGWRQLVPRLESEFRSRMQQLDCTLPHPFIFDVELCPDTASQSAYAIDSDWVDKTSTKSAEHRLRFG